MANKGHFISVFLCLAVSITGVAQNDFESFEKRMNNQFDAFQQRTNNEYNSFLRRVNAEYAAMLERAWAEYRVVAKIEVPEDKLKPIPPVVFPKKDENNFLIRMWCQCQSRNPSPNQLLRLSRLRHLSMCQRLNSHSLVRRHQYDLIVLIASDLKG